MTFKFQCFSCFLPGWDPLRLDNSSLSIMTEGFKWNVKRCAKKPCKDHSSFYDVPTNDFLVKLTSFGLREPSFYGYGYLIN
jgi:hypothetical protein